MDSRRALERAGIEPDPVIETYKAGIDRTLLRENLKRSVEERLRDLMRMEKFFEELQGAVVRSRKKRP